MKIVQSFWTKPSLTESNKLEKLSGGWPEIKYHLMSWALSCLTLKEYYPEIELVTDDVGAQLLIEDLKLPYSSVSTVLEELSGYSPKLWALGKLYAYKEQETAFIHVDSDVYIWKKFPDRIENAGLIAQSHEVHNLSEYVNALSHLKAHNFNLPEIISNIDLERGNIFPINAGILGGNDIEFLQYYARTAIEFVESNTPQWTTDFNGSQFAIVYEQLLFAALSENENKPIACYLDARSTDFLTLYDFSNKFGALNYVHLSSLRKSFFHSCLEVEMQLLTHYPDYHEVIDEYLKKT